jgi:hypothetical protein
MSPEDRRNEGPPCEKANERREPSLAIESTNSRLSLMDERVAQAGLDPTYLRKAKPEIYQKLQQACSKCPDPDSCLLDLEAGDWEAGQRSYCPNAAAIDYLIVSRS